jgi:hypothetical protein
MNKSFHGNFRVPYFWVRVSELQKGGKERAGRKGLEEKLG